MAWAVVEYRENKGPKYVAVWPDTPDGRANAEGQFRALILEAAPELEGDEATLREHLEARHFIVGECDIHLVGNDVVVDLRREWHQVWLLIGAENIRAKNRECLEQHVFDSLQELNAFLKGVETALGNDELEQFDSAEEVEAYFAPPEPEPELVLPSIGHASWNCLSAIVGRLRERLFVTPDGVVTMDLDVSGSDIIDEINTLLEQAKLLPVPAADEDCS